MKLEFTPFSAPDLPAYQAWFEDVPTAQRLSTPDAVWFRHVTIGNAAAWAVRNEAGTLVAVVEAEADEHDPVRAFVCVTVDPARRRQGIGAATLRTFVAGEGRRYAVIEGRIEPDNTVSLAMTRSAGFRQIGSSPDADGILRYEIRASWIRVS